MQPCIMWYTQIWDTQCGPPYSLVLIPSRQKTVLHTMTEVLAERDDVAASPADAGEAPASKRVRFAMSMSSNDAIHLAIVDDADQVEAGEIDFFSPAFTYHAFGKDEQIEGYDGLRVEVLFNARDFSAMLNVTYKGHEPRCDNIVAKITPSLPSAVTQDKEQFLEALRSSSSMPLTPPGALAKSYLLQVDGAERRFEIYECALDKNEAAQKLHQNMQMTSLWFIEGADAVDVTDSRWIVYITYERVSPERLLPVGFITLFKFFNPLGRKSGSSTATETHRICQALIFPTHQRQGHCEVLVDFIYRKVQSDTNVYEVTVEDPVPGFSKLRDYVDAKHCKEFKFFSIPPGSSDDIPAAQGTTSLHPSDIEAVQAKLKLTQRQVQRCYEIFKLGFIDRTNEEEYKKFRLEVKKRLFKLHAEDIEGMGAERRKAFLDAEYKQLEAIYDAILGKLGGNA